MSGFSADWLALREPADLRARNAELLAAVAGHFRDRAAVTITDLACGRGSTLRALKPHLPRDQQWRFVDDDERLLREAVDLATGVRAQARRADLQRELEAVLDEPADLIATSAFFDLVSADWLTRLAREAARRRLPVYAALSYDGRMACDPPHDGDAAVCDALNRHQRRDKGLGPALGPDAAREQARIFAAHGFRVATAPSDWRLHPAERELQRLLVDGWQAAARELGTIPATELAAWQRQRLAWIDAGRSEIVVGHVDLWAVPA